MTPTLTPDGKLACFRLRFYDYHQWEPKVGHYYTTTRDDLDLFQIVGEKDGEFVCRQISGEAFVEGDDFTFPVEGFTSEGFGDRRMWVPHGALSP